MPELLKHVYTTAYIHQLANALKKAHDAFPVQLFERRIFDPSWAQRALKARMSHITHTLHRTLDAPYPHALAILTRVCPQFNGYGAMFFPEFIGLYGINDWDASIPALAYFTQYSSSEFAVRPFIQHDPMQMMAQMARWAQAENPHIRRLASEGCRPRLPWASALNAFKQDPTPILPILAQLNTDPSAYVRKSVANNLNDIAKDHPDLVLRLAKQWLGAHPHTDWIVKHACRTLLKQGQPQALALFGWHPPTHIRINDLQCTAQLAIGQTLTFSFRLHTEQAQLGQLRLEYAIDFVRPHGKTTSKVFKITEGRYAKPCMTWRKQYSFRPINTRKYYPGAHHLRIIINGQVIGAQAFTLDAMSN